MDSAGLRTLDDKQWTLSEHDEPIKVQPKSKVCHFKSTIGNFIDYIPLQLLSFH